MSAKTVLKHRRYSNAERFFSRYNEDENGCWIWQGNIMPQRGKQGNFYGLFYANGKLRGAHVYSYEQKYGPVPEGLQIDHLCRVTLCVNPDHLEAVTGSVNVRRGLLVQRAQARRAWRILSRAFKDAANEAKRQRIARRSWWAA